MHVVQSITRPARLAFAFSHDASSRTIRRAFRLAGGRWRGQFDAIVRLDAASPISGFWQSALRALDPDYIFVIDPQLDRFDWEKELARLDLQPFEAVRLPERAETGNWSDYFAEAPTLGDPDSDQPVLNRDESRFSWREVARAGLPLTNTTRRLEPAGAPTPAQLSRSLLTSSNDATRWLIAADADDAEAAARFWTLRALGCRPGWYDESVLGRESPPTRLLRAVLWSAAAAQEDVVQTCERWSRRPGWIQPAPSLPQFRGARAYFAMHAEIAHGDRGTLHFSLPAPPLTSEPLSRRLYGVRERRHLSSDPDQPDGIVLARDAESRLLAKTGTRDEVRITHGGIAQVGSLRAVSFVSVPDIGYAEAVAAPLRAGGFAVSESDKGRYQQRSLELGRGLRFLAWALRQKESAQLMTLFDQYHLAGTPPDGYRRAVRFAEFETALEASLREKHPRMSAELRVRASRWLNEWADSLLERGLLIAGYVLACKACARRTFYRAEAVTQRFTCERCGIEGVVPVGAQRSVQLNEAFYQLRHHNGDVVTLLLATLRDQASRAFMYLPEVSLRGPNSEREVDAVVLRDGDLVVAEAKSNDQLTRTEADFYTYLAGRTNAKAVIFATTARERDLCRRLDCTRCAQQGEHHRDAAWSEGARTNIERVRSRLSARGVQVETACFNTLVTASAGAAKPQPP